MSAYNNLDKSPVKPLAHHSLSGLFLTTLVAAFFSAPAVHTAHATAAQEACVPESEEVIEWVRITDYIGSDAWSYCGKIFGGYEYFDLPNQHYLAIEMMGTNNLILGPITIDRTYSGETFGAEFEKVGIIGAKDNYDVGLLFRGGFLHTNASDDQYIGTFDPGLGYELGIPGVQGGPTGVILDFYPQNIVQDIHYTGSFNWSAGYFNVERRYEADDHAFGKYIGTLYSHLDLEEQFWGSIPGYLSDFSYHTRVRSDAIGLHGGIRGRRDIGQPLGDWQPQISARLELGAAYIDYEVDDSLTWNGFISGSIPNSQISISDSEFAAYGSLGVAFSLTNRSNLSQFFVDFQYENRPWFNSVVRNGTNASSNDASAADVYSLRFGARRNF